MTALAIAAPPVVTLPVANSDEKFPVRRVYCIGRNYAAFATESGQDPNRTPPVFFQKNSDNLNSSGVFPYPSKTRDVHHEPALDMTRWDLQQEQKQSGGPWEVSKAFEHSAPIGEIRTTDDIGHLEEGRIELKVNGEVRQSGNLNQMIWKVPELISYLSDYFTLAAGDVILSGTPGGVGPVKIGDVMEISIERLGAITVPVV